MALGIRIGGCSPLAGGGKKALVNTFALSSLLLTSVTLPSAFPVLIVGIHGCPPSPAGFFRYLFAIQMSLAIISSKYSIQCVRIANIIAFLYALLRILSSL